MSVPGNQQAIPSEKIRGKSCLKVVCVPHCGSGGMPAARRPDRRRPSFPRVSRAWPEIFPNVAYCFITKMARIRPRPSSARYGRTWPDVGQLWPGFDKHWALSDEALDRFSRIGSDPGQSWIGCGTLLATSAEFGRTGPNLGHIWLTPTKLGPIRPN